MSVLIGTLGVVLVITGIVRTLWDSRSPDAAWFLGAGLMAFLILSAMGLK